jgi:hypothetical protein
MHRTCSWRPKESRLRLLDMRHELGHVQQGGRSEVVLHALVRVAAPGELEARAEACCPHRLT